MTLPGPAELASRLAELTVQIDSVGVEPRDVPLPDYPGGPRPSSVVRLSGGGHSGLGENVAFTREDHERFAAFAQSWARTLRAGTRLRVGTALGDGGTPYERAALEAALIDLALRQAGLGLFELTGVREASLRFVVSLAAEPEPLAAIARLRAEAYTGDLKLDVDPAWNQASLAALARDSSVVIFDFKGRAGPEFAEKLAVLSPATLFEDPPAGFTGVRSGTRVARDASLKSVTEVAEACTRGEAVNLKAPRMGGPLCVLQSLALALAAGNAASAPVKAYLGGMFEVSVGRTQARQLAALYCGSAPNDLAPNAVRGERIERANSPAIIRFDQPGFGSR